MTRTRFALFVGLAIAGIGLTIGVSSLQAAKPADTLNPEIPKTPVGPAIEQPIHYSHKLHAGKLGIDCGYCHTNVDKSPIANYPNVETCMGKILLFTSLIVSYAYAIEMFLAWYGGNVYEKSVFWDRAFGHMGWAYWIMVTCNCLIPLLCIKKSIRTNIMAMFVISIFVNIGMWFERFVIIVQSLSHNFPVFTWKAYAPTWVELGITAGSFAWFFMESPEIIAFEGTSSG